jgi:hypothetical protein
MSIFGLKIAFSKTICSTTSEVLEQKFLRIVELWGVATILDRFGQFLKNGLDRGRGFADKQFKNEPWNPKKFFVN